jgi:hypothetical protein
LTPFPVGGILTGCPDVYAAGQKIESDRWEEGGVSKVTEAALRLPSALVRRGGKAGAGRSGEGFRRTVAPQLVFVR